MTTDAATLAPDLELLDDAGKPRRLAEFWSQRPAVVVFVRHLGCPFCREEAARLKRDAPRFAAAGAEVVLITMSPPEDAAEFRKRFDLPFSVLSDPDQRAYQAFGVPRGGIMSYMGPRTWGPGLAAVLKYGVGVPVGDVTQLSGGYVVDTHGAIRYAHPSKHSVDLPNHDELIAAVNEAK
jgi:peroxiredoxin